MRRARTVLALALVVAACGDEQPRGVQVTEARDDPRPPARPRGGLAFDSVYADSGLYADPGPDAEPGLDSLRRDSLRRDALPPSEAQPAAAPDFRAFWPRFRDAVRAGRQATAALTAGTGPVSPESFGETFETALGPPFREGVLALTPRDFRRDGTAREARVVVGYDADGQTVPQDEAVTESAVTLRFDVVEGTYRLVSLTVVG